jgi:hypothetical protein
MALKPIMGQPVNLIPQYEQSFGCDVENKYCVLYGKDENERIMVEMQQEPCGGNLVSNGEFVIDSDWTYDVNVVIADGKANHVVGTSGEIYQDIYSAFSLGAYFNLYFTVTGMSAGTIEVYMAATGTPTFIITENGIYIKYRQPPFDNTELRFVFSSDCDGSISFVSSFKLLNDTEIIANLLDSSGNPYVAMNIETIDDFVICWYYTFGIAEGCYTVQIIDPCVATSALLPVNILDNDFENTPPEWNIATNSGTIDFDLPDALTVTTGAITPVLATAVQPNPIPTGNDLFLQIEIYLAGGTDVGVFNLFLFVDDGTTSEIARWNNVASGHLTATVFVSKSILNVSVLDFGIGIENSTGNVGEKFLISYIDIKYAIASTENGLYTSNCLKVVADIGTTRIVEGFADEINPYPNGNLSLGFLFHRDFFWLRARLDVSFANPHNGIKQDNNLFSNGRKKKAFAQVTKLWDLNFIGADENMHDTISNIISCDKFTVESQEYLTDEKDYQPTWNTKSMIDIADSKIEVQKIVGTRFNNND